MKSNLSLEIIELSGCDRMTRSGMDKLQSMRTLADAAPDLLAACRTALALLENGRITKVVS